MAPEADDLTEEVDLPDVEHYPEDVSASVTALVRYQGRVNPSVGAVVATPRSIRIYPNRADGHTRPTRVPIEVRTSLPVNLVDDDPAGLFSTAESLVLFKRLGPWMEDVPLRFAVVLEHPDVRVRELVSKGLWHRLGVQVVALMNLPSDRTAVVVRGPSPWEEARGETQALRDVLAVGDFPPGMRVYLMEHGAQADSGWVLTNGIWRKMNGRSPGERYGVGAGPAAGEPMIWSASPALRTTRARQHAAAAQSAFAAGNPGVGRSRGGMAYSHGFQLRSMGQQIPESVWWASRAGFTGHARPRGGKNYFSQPTDQLGEQVASMMAAEGLI